MQRFIIKADHLELYEDVERLIPEHMKPDCVEMVMEIEEYVREDSIAKKGRRSPSIKAPKRVRNADIMRNIPAGACKSFVSVKDLLKGSSRKRKKTDRTFDELGEDDDDDLEIAAGLSRRTVSMPASGNTGQKRLKTSATLPSNAVDMRPRKKRAKQEILRTSPKVSMDALAEDDSDDETIANGLHLGPSKLRSTAAAHSQKSNDDNTSLSPETRAESAPPSRNALSPVSISSSPQPEGLESTRYGVLEPSKTIAASLTSSPVLRLSLDKSLAIDPTTPTRPNSPVIIRSSSPEVSITTVSKSLPSPPSSPVIPTEQPIDVPDQSMAWLVEDDDDFDIPLVGSSPFSRRIREQKAPIVEDDNVELLSSPSASVVRSSFGADRSHISDLHGPATSQVAMPPPALPKNPDKQTQSRVLQRQDDHSSSPALTFAVRRPSRVIKKLQIHSSPNNIASPQPRRIRRRFSQDNDNHACSPRPRIRKKRKFADVVEAQKHNPWIDVEASQSGSEMSEGSEAADVLSDSDRQFIVEDATTQVSPSYDQSAVYRRSLLTQVPAGTVPRFAKAPARRGAAAFGGLARPRPGFLPSSSPPRGSESDEYDFGSFVVDDDAELSYMNDTQASGDA